MAPGRLKPGRRHGSGMPPARLLGDADAAGACGTGVRRWSVCRWSAGKVGGGQVAGGQVAGGQGRSGTAEDPRCAAARPAAAPAWGTVPAAVGHVADVLGRTDRAARGERREDGAGFTLGAVHPDPFRFPTWDFAAPMIFRSPCVTISLR